MSTHDMSRLVRAVGLGVGAIFLSGVIACSGSGEEQSTTTVTETVKDTGSAAADPNSSEPRSSDPNPETTMSDEQVRKACASDRNSREVHRAVGQANRELQRYSHGWSYRGESNWSRCGDLTYARVDQADRAPHQAQTVVLLFHVGEYIGMDSDRPHTIDSITASPDGYGVDVTYREGSETSQVYFYWDAQNRRLAHEGDIPN